MATAAAELKLYLYVPSFHLKMCISLFFVLYGGMQGRITIIATIEICEHVFSASNECTKLMQHMTCFHHLQFFDMHFTQWDEDKYAELSKFLSVLLSVN